MFNSIDKANSNIFDLNSTVTDFNTRIHMDELDNKLEEPKTGYKKYTKKLDRFNRTKIKTTKRLC